MVYGQRMNFERILVDGYSVIYAWPTLRARKRRSLSAARNELIRLLAKFGDESEKVVTLVFDGGKSPPPEPTPILSPGLEVIFSKRGHVSRVGHGNVASRGQSADEVIERLVATQKAPAQLLVITEDKVERQVCEGFGAQVAGAGELWKMLTAARQEFSARLTAFQIRDRQSKKSQILS